MQLMRKRQTHHLDFNNISLYNICLLHGVIITWIQYFKTTAGVREREEIWQNYVLYHHEA